MKIITIQGGCSKYRKPVGFQFNDEGGRYHICGSFGITPGGAHNNEEKLNGEFLYGQYTRGCKICGNKYVYQCAHCQSFNCYDGTEHKGAECPVCGKKSNVPATTDKRIVRSAEGGAGNAEIILAIDISGSMTVQANGISRIEEMKRAAVNNFINSFQGVKMAVVTFASTVMTRLPFTTNRQAVVDAVNALSAYGGTASPLAYIYNNFADYRSQTNGINKYLVIFTDGEWDSTDTAYALSLKNCGVQIITIGCAGADQRFLRSIASPGASIEVSGSDFGSAYATAAKKISQ